jgi:hypothetical protein
MNPRRALGENEIRAQTPAQTSSAPIVETRDCRVQYVDIFSYHSKIKGPLISSI